MGRLSSQSEVENDNILGFKHENKSYSQCAYDQEKHEYHM